MPLDHLDYQYLQVFGAQTEGAAPAPDDCLTAVSFDAAGDHIAVGDCGGRIALFERARGGAEAEAGPPRYAFLAEYQSHRGEYDYVRSVDVQARVVAIRFLPARGDGELVYLTANDRDVKLWRCRAGASGKAEVVVRRNYSNASASSIVELLPRDDLFYLVDDFGVTQWWVEDPFAAYQLVDYRPAGLHDSIETLRCADLERSHGNLLAFGSNLGAVRYVDLRVASAFDKGASASALFTSPKSQIEAVKFVDPTFLAARDLCFLYVFDIRASRSAGPLQTLPINYALGPERVSALQHDASSLYEAFDLAVDRSRRFIATGNYGNLVHVYNREGTGLCFLATRAYRHRRLKRPYPGHSVLAKPLVHAGCYDSNSFLPPDKISPLHRVKHLEFHPTEDLLAVTTATNLFLYGARPDAECADYQRFDEFCAACKVG
ncbi:Protein phosphatase PP2A regulatory subunit B [Giardia muris]|uniref:Protein phosphatase PP2A regulatory subunit B n=1 Tax=Giardia muris TaxID=5742 RepID=A0A4Z1ST82_GIAMU|nr:Protein phosphatase PP2A regulatory subunit B [Giardia muris]|eukprot:TNJ26858.1 Protein phosphatase PP2A regulatory subunit B [Giardia muris]